MSLSAVCEQHHTCITLKLCSSSPYLTVLTSQQIPIVRAHITKLRLLIRCQSHISTLPIALLVLAPACCPVDDAGKNRHARESKAEREPSLVERRIRWDESKGCDDTSEISEANLPCAAYAAAMMAAQVWSVSHLLVPTSLLGYDEHCTYSYCTNIVSSA